MHILASDFDNTLFFHTGMKEKELKAIKEFQKQGNLFGVCTGRTLEGILRPSQNYDIHYDFYICNTGSYILDGQKNIIMQKRIPMETAIKLHELVGKDIHMSISVDENMYHIDKHKISKYPGTRINDIHEINVKEIDACSFHYPNGHIEEATKMINKIRKHLGTEVNVYQNNEHLDCTALGCSKGEGIEIIKNHFNVKEINGIGDAFNDLPMFEHVTYSYTFDYSDDEVKDKAHFIVKSIDECIHQIIKK